MTSDRHFTRKTLYHACSCILHIWEKEGMILFNDIFNIFILCLILELQRGIFYMHHPTDRVAHTTAFIIQHCGALAGTRRKEGNVLF